MTSTNSTMNSTISPTVTSSIGLGLLAVSGLLMLVSIVSLIVFYPTTVTDSITEVVVSK